MTFTGLLGVLLGLLPLQPPPKPPQINLPAYRVTAPAAPTAHR